MIGYDTRRARGSRFRFSGLVAFVVFLAVSERSLGQSPEYLTSEAPIPSNLRETLSATGRIGVLPESRPLDEMLMPGIFFPELRKLVPRSGVPFIDDAIYRVSPRAYYRHRDNGDGSTSESFAYGGAIGVESGYIADTIRFGVTGYTSQKIYGPSDRVGTGLLAPVQEGYWVLGEAYADIKLEGAHATLYRQRLDLPYINASDSRMTPNTFEAYGVHFTGVPKLQTALGHVQKMKFRNSTDFVPLSVRAGALDSNRGVSVAGARYDFSEDTYVGLIEEYGWDTFNIAYVEAGHFLPITDDLTLKTGLQFTDQRSVGDELVGEFDSQHLGYKLSLGYQSLIRASSFTWTSDGHRIRKPWGGSPSYNSVMISDFDRAGEQAIRTGISYDFSDLGLEGFAASASWVYGNTPDSGSDASPDQQEFDVNIDYRPTVIGLDNLWFRLRYAVNDRDASLDGLDREDLRIILNYSFSF